MIIKKWLVAAGLTLCVANASLVYAQSPEHPPEPPAKSLAPPSALSPEPEPEPIGSFTAPNANTIRFTNAAGYNDMVRLLADGLGINPQHLSQASGAVTINGITYNTLDFGYCPALTSKTAGTATFSIKKPSQIRSFISWLHQLSPTDAARYGAEFQMRYRTASGATLPATFAPSVRLDDADEIDLTITVR